MFIPLDDLSDKTEAQRQEYYIEACKFLGVPPELNVLKWFWDDSKQGKRALILYATRGATDIIRANHNISVTALEQTAGAGYVIFTATGQNDKGRVERAVGVAHLEGLRGAKFENAVKKAQTEALRRMTLQFAGGGFIDESELPNYDTTVPAEMPFKAVGAPIPAVQNNEPGKDITPTVSTVPTTPATGSLNAPVELKPEDYTVGVRKVSEEELAAHTAQQQALRDEAAKQLAEKAAAKTEEAPKPEAPKRKRKSKNAATVDTPEQIAAQPAAPVAAPEPPKVEAKQPEPPAPQVVTQGVVSPVVPTTAPVEGAPTSEQLKDYRARLGKYANEILPTAGMLPTAGIGGVTMKLRAFAQLQIGVEVGKATAEQWEDLFSFLDEYTAKKGAAELVKYIDAALVK